MNINSSDNSDLFDFLNKFIDSEIYMEDEKPLNDRLLLREDDNCVVGILPEEELTKIIKSKKEQISID